MSESVLWPLSVIVAVSLLIGGLVVVSIGRRSTTGELKRNQWSGIRTSATMASDEAWAVGQRAGAPMTIAGGWVMAATGPLLLLWRSLLGLLVLTTIGSVGGLALVVLGAIQGHRAAKVVDPPD